MIICEISLFVMLRSVTAANRAKPFCSGNLQLLTRVWRRLFGGTGGESVNFKSSGYPEGD